MGPWCQVRVWCSQLPSFWAWEVTLTFWLHKTHNGAGPQVGTEGQLQAQGSLRSHFPRVWVYREGARAGGALREEGSASAQSLRVPGPGSSFWQQHKEGSLQEAAEAAECSHKPVGVEARVAADHTLEDVGLQGGRDS